MNKLTVTDKPHRRDEPNSLNAAITRYYGELENTRSEKKLRPQSAADSKSLFRIWTPGNPSNKNIRAKHPQNKGRNRQHPLLRECRVHQHDLQIESVNRLCILFASLKYMDDLPEETVDTARETTPRDAQRETSCSEREINPGTCNAPKSTMAGRSPRRSHKEEWKREYRVSPRKR